MSETKKETVTFIGNGVVNDPATSKELCRFVIKPIVDPEGNEHKVVRDMFGQNLKGEFTTDDKEKIIKLRKLGYKEK